MEQSNVQQQIISKAMTDEAFRQQLLSHPKETVERELGINLPQEVNIYVHEDTPTTLHVVLPPREQESEPVELSDTELETVGGGISDGCGLNYTYQGQVGCTGSAFCPVLFPSTHYSNC